MEQIHLTATATIKGTAEWKQIEELYTQKKQAIDIIEAKHAMTRRKIFVGCGVVFFLMLLLIFGMSFFEAKQGRQAAKTEETTYYSIDSEQSCLSYDASISIL
ncbi:MAG: hypothetical protein IKP74_09010 [Clostridia bacterium]|nr:hypothetical protein [Clostridia bacterium]